MYENILNGGSVPFFFDLLAEIDIRVGTRLAANCLMLLQLLGEIIIVIGEKDGEVVFDALEDILFPIRNRLRELGIHETENFSNDEFDKLSPDSKKYI